MYPIQSKRWVGRSTRSLLVLLLVVVGALLPAMAQASQAATTHYSYGYDWDEDDGCADHYYVRHGDTLSRIAARYGVSVYAIAHRNGIYNINRIYPGQYFCIPERGAHDRYDDEYGYGYHEDEEEYGYGHEDGYGYGHHKRHEDDSYGKHGDHEEDGYGDHNAHDSYGYHDYEFTSEDLAEPAPGYYQTNGGHTGVCYYPDPRYNSDEAEFYEADERPDCD